MTNAKAGEVVRSTDVEKSAASDVKDEAGSAEGDVATETVANSEEESAKALDVEKESVDVQMEEGEDVENKSADVGMEEGCSEEKQEDVSKDVAGEEMEDDEEGEEENDNEENEDVEEENEDVEEENEDAEEENEDAEEENELDDEENEDVEKENEISEEQDEKKPDGEDKEETVTGGTQKKNAKKRPVHAKKTTDAGKVTSLIHNVNQKTTMKELRSLLKNKIRPGLMLKAISVNKKKNTKTYAVSATPEDLKVLHHFQFKGKKLLVVPDKRGSVQAKKKAKVVKKSDAFCNSNYIRLDGFPSDVKRGVIFRFIADKLGPKFKISQFTMNSEGSAILPVQKKQTMMVVKALNNKKHENITIRAKRVLHKTFEVRCPVVVTAETKKDNAPERVAALKAAPASKTGPASKANFKPAPKVAIKPSVKAAAKRAPQPASSQKKTISSTFEKMAKIASVRAPVVVEHRRDGGKSDSRHERGQGRIADPLRSVRIPHKEDVVFGHPEHFQNERSERRDFHGLAPRADRYLRQEQLFHVHEDTSMRFREQQRSRDHIAAMRRHDIELRMRMREEEEFRAREMRMREDEERLRLERARRREREEVMLRERMMRETRAREEKLREKEMQQEMERLRLLQHEAMVARSEKEAKEREAREIAMMHQRDMNIRNRELALQQREAQYMQATREESRRRREILEHERAQLMSQMLGGQRHGEFVSHEQEGRRHEGREQTMADVLHQRLTDRKRQREDRTQEPRGGQREGRTNLRNDGRQPKVEQYIPEPQVRF